MYVLYLDEFGHSGAWDPANPNHCHHPLFGLAGLCLEGSRIKQFDRGYLRLKQSFYRREIARAASQAGIRPERYEPKRLRSRRDHRFAAHVLKLIESSDGTLFAHGIKKRTGLASHNEKALDTSTTQGLMRQYERFLRQSAGSARGRGIIVLDERSGGQDENLLASAQSHLYSHSSHPFERLVEVPLLVPSEWYHGVQAADTVCRVVANVFRFRRMGESKYQKDEAELGGLIDALSKEIGNWNTVYLR